MVLHLRDDYEPKAAERWAESWDAASSRLVAIAELSSPARGLV